jgi:drug/metabolite transporter (DMT)-like permease
MNTDTLKLLAIILIGAIINFVSSYKNQQLVTKNNIYAIITLSAIIYTILILIIVPLIVGPTTLKNEILNLSFDTHKEVLIVSIASVVSTFIWLYLLTNTQFVRLKLLDYVVDVGVTLLGTALLFSGHITPQKIFGAILLVIAVVIMEHDNKNIKK